MKPIINWDEIRKTHTLREKIVLAVAENGKPMSPNELAKKLKQGLSQVSYHVNELRKNGSLILKDEQPRRGAVEHFYALSPKVLLTDAQRAYESGVEDLDGSNFEGAAREFKAALDKLLGNKPAAKPKKGKDSK
jgi:biotin operon repressor